MQTNILISDLIKYNSRYLLKKLGGIEKSKLFVRPNHNLNPLIWIFGHIVFSRAEMVEVMGIDPQAGELAEFFASGTFPRNDPAEYPHIDELAASLDRLGDQIADLLNEGGDKLLARRAWGKYDTVGKHIVSGYIHESYHVGEINYLNNLLDKGNMNSTRLNLATKKKSGTGKILLDNLKSVLTVK
jgi:hypothetical protein